MSGLGAVGVTKGYNITADSYPPFANTDKDEELWDEAADMSLDYYVCSHEFRVEPDEEMLVPFFTAFTKAVSRMLLLKKFALWSLLRFTVGHLDKYEGLNFSRVSSLSEGLLPDAGLA